MKKFIIAVALLLSSGLSLSKELPTSQPPFNIPDGYSIYNVKKDLEFDELKIPGYAQEAFTCYQNPASSSICNSKNYGFDDKGLVSIEGRILDITYRKTDGGEASKLLLKRNYLAVVESLGGKKYAFNERSGKEAYLIDKNGQKTFVILQVFGDMFSLLTVTNGGYKSILTASKLAEDIDKQGYVTINVNFDTNKSIIKDQDKPALNEVVALLQDDTDLKLSVDGHTDNVGNAAANKTLSKQRSDSIVKYLTSNGVAADRLVAKGFGSEKPVADNRSEEGRAKNRRVELVKF